MMSTAKPQRHSHASQASYAVAELGVSAIESFLRLYLMIFLTDRIGLPPEMAGYAVAIGVLWDAFADPILGRISDKTRSRWGRRLPWMIAGAPILALSFVELFSINPANTSSTQMVFWQVTILNILLNSAMTMVSIPHLALGQDIASGKEERTSLYAWRTLMTLLGLLAGILVPVIYVAFGYDTSIHQKTMAAAISVICLASSMGTIGSMWKSQVHANGSPAETSSTIAPVNNRIANPIKILMAAFFVATLGQGLNSTWALYFYRYSLELSEQSLGMVLIVFIVSLCATLPLWVYLSRRVSKSRLIAIGTIALGIATGIVYPILPKQSMTGPIFMALIGGIFLGSTGLLESLLVDVAEISNIAESAMGQVFGIWKFVAKAARAAAIAIGGYALGVVGYTPLAATVPPDVAKSIGFLFGPIVAVFFILSGVIILFVREIKPDQSTT